MNELADDLVLSRGGATRLIARMEEEGLVTRETPADDRRATYAVVTPRASRRSSERCRCISSSCRSASAVTSSRRRRDAARRRRADLSGSRLAGQVPRRKPLSLTAAARSRPSGRPAAARSPGGRAGRTSGRRPARGWSARCRPPGWWTMKFTGFVSSLSGISKTAPYASIRVGCRGARPVGGHAVGDRVAPQVQAPVCRSRRPAGGSGRSPSSPAARPSTVRDRARHRASLVGEHRAVGRRAVRRPSADDVVERRVDAATRRRRRSASTAPPPTRRWNVDDVVGVLGHDARRATSTRAAHACRPRPASRSRSTAARRVIERVAARARVAARCRARPPCTRCCVPGVEVGDVVEDAVRRVVVGADRAPAAAAGAARGT